jgi:hypothetical protein
MVSKVLNLKWNRWNKTEISRSRSGQKIQNEIEYLGPDPEKKSIITGDYIIYFILFYILSCNEIYVETK